MNRTLIALATLLIPHARAGPAGAWSHANYHGGSTSHTAGLRIHDAHRRRWRQRDAHVRPGDDGDVRRTAARRTHKEGSGETTATGAYGGSATHYAGQGTTATGAYGGSAYHAEGSGYTTYTGANGATAYHSPYYGAAYPAYHPPTTVNYYGSGCYNCGGWNTAGAAAAGAVVGMAAGAAVASANTAAATSNAYAAGAATANANTANAYNAGVVAGATGAVPVAVRRPRGTGTFAMGGVYAALPADSISIPKNGTTYYLNGNTWFQPSFGANGVYYRVVPAP